MSIDWVADIHELHEVHGHTKAVASFDNEKKLKYLEYRFSFLKEELEEGMKALGEGDSEEIVDAMVDLCVIAIGTLDLYGVNPYKAWDEVHRANMAKNPGVKKERPNPLGLPDMIKPEGWVGPDHTDNHGILSGFLDK